MQLHLKNKKSKIFSTSKAFLTIITMFILLSGCGKFSFFGNDEEEVDLSIPLRELIVQGMDQYNIGKYFLAVKYFEKILDLDPFSSEAVLAELKAADCHYYMNNYLEARLLYSEFEERHPTNEAIPYVLYQKGMCNYKRIDRIDRDTDGAEDSIQDFTQLIRAYPNSPYTDEAKARIRAAKEFLVNHEYFVVKYYMKAKKYSQAETRLKYIISMYPESHLTPKAQELLEQIEDGAPPRSSYLSWFPEFSLPNWASFSSEDETPEEIPQEYEEEMPDEELYPEEEL